ncbi:AbfB domain-containing protein [Archangium violaceum]|uniref:AbfB domain-containing protein n=1 Tax=Archangium violaceum TaxID=83451 RepID=UPI001EF733E7|nr:AbfB domain-containing protein [Archangium violaceum]
MKSSSRASRLTGALVGLSLWTLAPAASAQARSLEPRLAADKRAQRELPAGTPVERLVVKFHEGSRVRLRGEALVSLAAERSEVERSLLANRGLSEARLSRDVRSVQALLERAPRLGAPRRLFTEAELSLELRKEFGEAQSGRQLADLNLYYEVPLLPRTTAEDVADLVAELNALDSVEVAYVQPPAEPAMVNFGMDEALRGLLAAVDISPTTPLYEADQGYLNAAPTGVDARYAWTVPGGDGSGVRFVDIEGGWRTSHEDMPGLFTQLGTQINDIGWRNHGTAVLGTAVGVGNAYGVRGIAYGATTGVSGIGNQSAASAITSAASAVGRGGVILVELHAQGPADSTPCTCNQGQCNYIAMEYWQGEFDAISTATANGVTVVEAAGNGSANLDEGAYGNAFNRSVRDSGAILVGASGATTRAPTCWTNFGSRVDVHGWGENVVTMGYGDRFGSAYGEDQYYTSTFSGTSSASPVVAGSALSIQGAVRARGQGALDPRAVRSLLANTGTPQASDSRKIGPLPNLRKALQAGLLPINRYRSFQVVTPNFTNRYMRHAGSLGYTEVVDGASSTTLKQDATFKIIPGLADASCYSFEARNFPGSYLRHQSNRVRLDARNGTALFDQDATFCARAALDGSQNVSLEARNLSGSYLRHRNGELWVEAIANTQGDRQDATWAVVTPRWRNGMDLPVNTYRSLQVVTPGFTNRYLRHQNSLGYTEVVDGASDSTLKQDATFKIVAGLADASCYSLEARNFPGRYLRHASDRVRLDARDGTALFDQDATFCAQPALFGTGTSFESYNFPGRYLRHSDSQAWLAGGGASTGWDKALSFSEDASWNLVSPWAP